MGPIQLVLSRFQPIRVNHTVCNTLRATIVRILITLKSMKNQCHGQRK